MPETDKAQLSQELLDILACPACDDRPPVELTEDQKFLKCNKCKRKYPIADGRIPQMVVDEAVMEDAE